jgi:hypothetical protein
MPRKKEEPAPDVFDEAIAKGKAATPSDAGTPADSAPSEAATKKPYIPAPDPFGLHHDILAGVHLRESRKYHQMQIVFDEKPSQAIIDKIKEGGYRWNRESEMWTRQMNQDNAMQTRVDADRLFKEVAKLIRTERGIGQSQGVA